MGKSCSRIGNWLLYLLCEARFGLHAQSIDAVIGACAYSISQSPRYSLYRNDRIRKFISIHIRPAGPGIETT